MSSGEIAAKVAAESLEAGDTSEKFLSIYQNKWKNDFGKDIDEFLKFHIYQGDEMENFVKLASKDKKFGDIALSIVQGDLSIRDYKVELIYRGLIAYFKNLFSVD